MIRHRSSRYLGAFLALVSMLCMQLAMAAYVCPGMEMADTPAMSHCDGMDMQPVLCQAHTHDQGSKQTADQPELPVVQPFIAVQLHLVLPLLTDDAQTASSFPAPALLAHATAPPFSIQYCCFRI